MPLKKKITKGFGKIPKIVRTDKVILLKKLDIEKESEDIELEPLLYGKGQGGRGRGIALEAPVGKKKKKDEQPYKMSTTTAKASWRK